MFLLYNKLSQLHEDIPPLFFWVSFPPSSPQALSRVPCAMPSLLTSYLFYIWRAYLSIPVSPFLPPPRPFLSWWPYFYCLCLCLYFSFANRFICTIFLDVHICMLICNIWFSLSDLLHCVWQPLDPSTCLQRAKSHCFLWLSNIPLYTCITSSLSSHLPMAI